VRRREKKSRSNPLKTSTPQSNIESQPQAGRGGGIRRIEGEGRGDWFLMFLRALSVPLGQGLPIKSGEEGRERGKRRGTQSKKGEEK